MTPSPQDPVSQSPSPPQSENIDYGVSGLCGLPPSERAKWWLTALAFWLPDDYSGPVQDIKATELLSIEERIVLVEAALEFILTMQNKSHTLRKTGRGAIKSPNRERWANANKPLEFKYSVVIQLLQDAINAPREYSETDTHEAAYIRMRELKLEVKEIEKDIAAARKNNVRFNFSPHRYYDPHEKKRRTNWAFGGWDGSTSASDWISKSDLKLSSNTSKSHLNPPSKSNLISNSSNVEAPESMSVSRERAPMPKRKRVRKGNLVQLEQQPMVKVKIEEEGMISLADDADTNVDTSPSPSQSRIEPQYPAQAPLFSFQPPRSNPVAGPSKPRLTIPTRSSSNSVKLEPEAESASASAASPPPWSPTESSPSSSSFSSPNSCRPQAIPPWMPVNPDYAYRQVHPQPHPQHVHAYLPPRPFPHPPPPHAPQPRPSHPHRQIPRPSHGDAESIRRPSEWSSSSAQLPPIQYVYAQAALGAMERGGEFGSGSA